MRKKTIGEVLRLARINQGMSLEDLQKNKKRILKLAYKTQLRRSTTG